MRRWIPLSFIVFIIFSTEGTGRSTAAEMEPRPPGQISETASLIWPISGSTIPDTGTVSSPFGPRWQASKSRYDYHPGIDISAPANTPIHAVASGTVYSVGWSTADSGLMVVIYHPSLGLYSAYLHLNSASVIVGQTVAQGDIIGLVGDSGTTDFMHLHFEIRLTPGNYPASTRNPMGYLPHPELGAPTIQISNLNTSPIYRPTVSLAISTTRQEIDLNKVRVILQDRVTGIVLDDQMVDFNQRLHTGSDTLDQDGIQLMPSHFNTTTLEYQLTAKFYNLHGANSFILTAQAVDAAGNMSQVVAEGSDTTTTGKVLFPVFLPFAIR